LIKELYTTISCFNAGGFYIENEQFKNQLPVSSCQYRLPGTRNPVTGNANPKYKNKELKTTNIELKTHV